MSRCAGDRVEALGFVSQGDYTPALHDGIYRKLSASQPLQPARVTPDEALKGNHDCQLVQVTARLLDRSVQGTERYLVLQEEGFIFHAYLNQAEGRDPFAALQNGSRVSLTGVCRIEIGDWLAGEDWRAKSFRVQLRSIGDVLVSIAFVVDLAPSIMDCLRGGRGGAGGVYLGGAAATTGGRTHARVGDSNPGTAACRAPAIY